jgi:putative transposase
MFSDDITIARERFKQFNEKNNDDQCLEDQPQQKRLTDEEARLEIMKWLGLGAEEIAQVKSLPKVKRQEVLRKVKEIDGLSLRQAARIFGVSMSLISRA